MEMERSQGRRRILLVPSPFQGHITPMLALGGILHSNGFSITVVHTQFNSPRPSDHPHFQFLPIPDNKLPSGEGEGEGEGEGVDTSKNLFALLMDLNAKCKEPFQEVLNQTIMASSDGEQIACIIYDHLMYLSEDVANHLKLPSIRLRTNSAVSVVTFLNLLPLYAQGLIPVQDSKLLDMVPGLHPLRFKDLPVPHFATSEDVLRLVPILTQKTSSSAIIWNTMDDLEHSSLAELQQYYQVPIFAIGPFHKIAPPISSTSLLKEDESCISWLDRQAPASVIYVSFGSLNSMDEKAATEIAWGLANSNQPFLWVIRPGSVRGSEWIEKLPEDFRRGIGERGRIVKWAPQRQVLAHTAVGGFWSHCGWNSILESIAEGVPMICWPDFGDQKVAARYLCCEWGMALELGQEGLERGEIERTVRRLMEEKEGEGIRKRALDFRNKAELAVKEGGSSYIALNDLIKHIQSL